MRNLGSMNRAFLMVLAALPAAGAYAQAAEKTYAQVLVAEALAHHPQVNGLTMHVAAPGGNANVVVASNVAPLGQPANDQDLTVIKTGEPRVQLASAGDRLTVELPLLDASRRTIGAIDVLMPYAPNS